MANEETQDQINLNEILNELLDDQNKKKKYGNSTILDRIDIMQKAVAAEDDIGQLTIIQNDLKEKGNQLLKDGKKGLAAQYKELHKNVTKKLIQLKIDKEIKDNEEKKLNLAKKNSAEFNKMSKSALTMFGITGGIVGLFKMFNKMTRIIGQNFGAIGMTNKEFKKDMMATAVEVTKLGYGLEDVSKVMSTLTKSFGFSRNEAKNLAGSIIDTSLALGISNEEGSQLVGNLMKISGMSSEAAQNFAKQTALLAEASGAAPTAVMKDIAKSSKAIAMFTAMTPENLMKAAIQANKLGTTLDAIANQMSGMLNFQESLNKEITASIMLGRTLNLQRLRELALAGKAEEFAVELTKQVGGQEEFQRMLLPQRQALAAALNMDVEAMAKMVNNQEKVRTLGDAIAQQDGLEKMIGPEALDNVAKIINNLKTVGVQLATSIGPAVATIAGGIASFFGTLQEIKILVPLITGLMGAMAGKAALNFAFSVATMLGKAGALTAFLGPAGILYAMAIPAIVAGIVGGVAAAASFEDLPIGKGANLKAGAAMFHKGETVVNDVDLAQLAKGSGGMSKDDMKQAFSEAIAPLNLEMRKSKENIIKLAEISEAQSPIMSRGPGIMAQKLAEVLDS